jgi:hypothetical protein
VGLTLQTNSKVHHIITEVQVRLSISEEVVQRMVRARRAEMVILAKTSRKDMPARPQQVSWEPEEV